MTTRESAPIGAPCWSDLWTSDVEGSAKFYSELLGWEAQEPNPEFGGYFMFTRAGVPIAGGMGGMGDMPASNTWRIYLAVRDAEASVEAARSAGAEVLSPAMAVADLGVQADFNDPTGAHFGLWQPGTFPGFTVLAEPGAPSWFELLTRDHGAAVAFYQTAFGWETENLSDTHEFRYTLLHPSGHDFLAGIMDASSFLPAGTNSHWRIYWEVEDVDASVKRVSELGGSVTSEPADTPYGRMASVADPAGAEFSLRTGPRGA
jgi:uncharacterized protein